MRAKFWKTGDRAKIGLDFAWKLQEQFLLYPRIKLEVSRLQKLEAAGGAVLVVVKWSWWFCVFCQYCRRTASRYTPPSWTPTSMSSVKMLPASHTSAWHSTSTAKAGPAPRSLKRLVSGTAEMASGWTSTTTALEPLQHLSSEDHTWVWTTWERIYHAHPRLLYVGIQCHTPRLFKGV